MPYDSLLTIIWGIALIPVIIILAAYLKFNNTEYHKQTKNSFFKTVQDKGLYGEYLTYKYLRNLPGYKRFIFNVYLPKEKEETTETDVILIHESGVYVIESKNYSGWIFGTETQRQWTQSLPAGKGRSKKFQFLNPIIQNKVHIKWLNEYLQEDVHFISYIVFSDRCELKEINLSSSEHHVINRYDIFKSISETAQKTGNRLSARKIDRLYDKLSPLTQLTDAQKQQHIKNIKEKYNKA